MEKRTQATWAVILVIAVGVLIWYGFFDFSKIPVAFEVHNTTINLEIADTDAERTLGLGGRDSLDYDTGMLFVFPRSGKHAFWMKGMQFSIDILWIDKKFEVVHLESNVSPESYPKTIYSPEEKSSFVLELNAGRAQELGIIEGSQLDPVFEN